MPLPTLADTTPVSEGEVAAAATLLRALLRESTQPKPHFWSFGLDLAALPSYQQMHALSAAGRLALAGQAVAQFKARAPTKPEWRVNQHLSYQLEERLLRHLLDFSTDFQPADYVTLLFSYLPTEAESEHWHAFDFPVELTLDKLGQLLKPAGPTADVRDALGRLLDEPAFRATNHDYPLRAAIRQFTSLVALGAAPAKRPFFGRRQLWPAAASLCRHASRHALSALICAVRGGHGQQAHPAVWQAGPRVRAGHRAGGFY